MVNLFFFFLYFIQKLTKKNNIITSRTTDDSNFGNDAKEKDKLQLQLDGLSGFLSSLYF
jgi:hypothetical protein